MTGNDEQPLKIGPWTRKSRKTEYENPWIRVSHDEVKTPAGTDGIYGVVHFKGRAVGVIALDEEQHIWLVGQTRYVLGSYSWEIPEGGAPLHEPPLDGARRELLEETGLSADTWEQILHLHLSNSVSDEEAIVYLAMGLTRAEACPEDTEDITTRRVSIVEALAMVQRADITDAISVAAIYAVARRLNL